MGNWERATKGMHGQKLSNYYRGGRMCVYVFDGVKETENRGPPTSALTFTDSRLRFS